MLLLLLRPSCCSGLCCYWRAWCCCSSYCCLRPRSTCFGWNLCCCLLPSAVDVLSGTVVSKVPGVPAIVLASVVTAFSTVANIPSVNYVRQIAACVLISSHIDFSFGGVFLHLVLYFVTLFIEIIEIEEYIFSQKTFSLKHILFTHQLNVLFQFL